MFVNLVAPGFRVNDEALDVHLVSIGDEKVAESSAEEKDVTVTATETTAE